MLTYGQMLVVDVEITPDNAAYADGDVVGGLQTVSPQHPTPGGGYLLNAVALVDEDNEGAALDLHLFDAAPASIADQAAFAPTYADLCKRVRKVSLADADYETENSLKVIYVEDLNDIIPNPTFYFYLVCNGSTPTFAADTGLTVRLFLLT